MRGTWATETESSGRGKSRTVGIKGKTQRFSLRDNELMISYFNKAVESKLPLIYSCNQKYAIVDQLRFFLWY